MVNLLVPVPVKDVNARHVMAVTRVYKQWRRNRPLRERELREERANWSANGPSSGTRFWYPDTPGPVVKI